MSQGEEHIVFEVETSRILQILAQEIYDSPYALLRENVQNAYDAILMRCTERGEAISDHAIEVTVKDRAVSVTDDGIGMTEDVLRHNFWKAGASGKRSDLAKKAGVVGTFGIGAMANFGVCRSLKVTTRNMDSDTTLVSTAVRDELRIGRDCISLERIREGARPGTKVEVELDEKVSLTPQQAIGYLTPYVRFLALRVAVNDTVISGQAFQDHFAAQSQTASVVGARQITAGPYGAHLEVKVKADRNVIACLTQVTLQGAEVHGELYLVQSAGALMGYRNYFGLAPVPVNSYYQFGGAANLSILQPTAGREALSRESIEHVNALVRAAEVAISEILAITDVADGNTGFLQYIHEHNRTDLAERVTVEVRPDGVAVPLGGVSQFCAGRRTHYYAGRDAATIQAFSSGDLRLLHLSQGNPRRGVQLRYVTQVLKVPEVPERPTVTKIYFGPDLTLAEAAFLLRVGTTLQDDYLLFGADVRFADITYGVGVHVEGGAESLKIYIARESGIVKPVLECHRTAYEVFGDFVKDFVRVHLYQQISRFVPSSTREGADALIKLMQRSRELYRYEESEFGPLEPLLADYLADKITFAEVLQAATTAVRPHTQTVTSAQVGSIEKELPGIDDAPAPTPEEVQQQYGAAPPVLRADLSSPMKVLVAGKSYPQLNGFALFVGLSDRLFNRDGSFFHQPHTTKIIWGSHRIVYIFAHASRELTLYYDIELKDALEEEMTGGGVFPSTTIIMKNRIYVPVPAPLENEFRVSEGAKAFYVRYDVI